MKLAFLTLIFAVWVPRIFAIEVRIKDIAEIKGNRTNQVTGIGLVVGLAASGDSSASLATNQMTANLMTRLGVETLPQGVLTQSIAVVAVTGDLPAFARNGSKIDVKASVVGDAKSLIGGTLMPTRLKAGDGQVYVVAGGQVLSGGADGVGPRTQTVVTIPLGGMVEREFKPDLVQNGVLSLTLKDPDFTTSFRISESVNRHFKGFYAVSIDPSSVEIKLPELFRTRLVGFVAELEGLKLEKDSIAVVVINERTGTVVMGAEVTIQPIVVSHGELTIKVGNADQSKSESLVPVPGATVGQLVQSLNALGIKPVDLVGIIQAVHAAGALNAKLRML